VEIFLVAGSRIYATIRPGIRPMAFLETVNVRRLMVIHKALSDKSPRPLSFFSSHSFEKYFLQHSSELILKHKRTFKLDSYSSPKRKIHLGLRRLALEQTGKCVRGH
jgi:hypothetical protein